LEFGTSRIASACSELEKEATENGTAWPEVTSMATLDEEKDRLPAPAKVRLFPVKVRSFPFPVKVRSFPAEFLLLFPAEVLLLFPVEVPSPDIWLCSQVRLFFPATNTHKKKFKFKQNVSFLVKNDLKQFLVSSN
jgi:hypothetical protein